MSDFDLKLENIAEGLVIETYEKKKDDTARKRRMLGNAFTYIREQTGMNKKQFAEYLAIPYRTMQDWELGNSQVPEYLLRLVAYKVLMEKERGRL